MTINALNSGAKVWLADFEDANTPLWKNMVDGQLNLRDALDRTTRSVHGHLVGWVRGRHDELTLGAEADLAS